MEKTNSKLLSSPRLFPAETVVGDGAQFRRLSPTVTLENGGRWSSMMFAVVVGGECIEEEGGKAADFLRLRKLAPVDGLIRAGIDRPRPR